MRQAVRFANLAGHQLAGTLELPDAGPPRGFALFAHCFTCTQNSHGARRISAALGERGIATLRFDFTGLGRSEGAFRDSHFSANVGDLTAAAEFLRNHHHAPTLLIGHSLGGAAVIAAARHVPEARAVITLGAPFEVDHVLAQLGDAVERIEAEGEGEVAIGGRPFWVNRGFIDEARGHDQRARLAALGKALLVMHSPTDQVVGIDEARGILEAARHPKSFVSLPDADHLLTDSGQAQYVADLITAWAEPYLPTVRTPERRELAEGHVMVETAGGKFRQHIYASGHHLTGDEPAAMGGTNMGPTPYDLLLAALGTCTSMTIKLVADREGIPLEHVAVTLEHKRCHSDDCAEAGTGRPRIELIERKLRFTGDLTAEQTERLLAIADRCPVHRTLESEPVIRTTLVKD